MLWFILLAVQLAGQVAGQVTPPAQALIDDPLTPPVIVYPAEAKATRIQGTVTLEVTVAANGQVTGVQALSGPVALRQAAVEAYLHATYKPLLKDGKPTPAVISTHVDFALKELPPDTDLLRQRAFAPLHAQCQELSAQKDPDSVDVCRKALDMANTFSTGFDPREHADAYNDLVLALIEAKRKPEAAKLGDEAVPLFVNSNPAVAHHSEAAATAYITRAEIRSLTKDFKGSVEDCTAAEEILRTLLQDEAEVDRAANLRRQVQETLLLHAVVLDQLHKSGEAKKLREQAKYI